MSAPTMEATQPLVQGLLDYRNALLPVLPDAVFNKPEFLSRSSANQGCDDHSVTCNVTFNMSNFPVNWMIKKVRSCVGGCP